MAMLKLKMKYLNAELEEREGKNHGSKKWNEKEQHYADTREEAKDDMYLTSLKNQ